MSSSPQRPPRSASHRRNSHGSSFAAPNIMSTAGVEYDSIRVLDEAVSSHGTIYYSVHVSCMESPLDNYTIRRRYNDFKSFHATLSRHMPTAPFGFVAFKAAIKSIDEDEPDRENPAASPVSHADTTDVVYLPPMPIGGLLAIMTSKDTLIRSRIAMFNRILEAALEANSPPVADALKNFIKEAPGGTLHRTLSSMSDTTSDKRRTKSRSSSGSSYVSLRDYAAPELTLSLERDARRRTASFGRQTNRLFLDCAIKAVEAVEGATPPLSSSTSSTASASSADTTPFASPFDATPTPTAS
ncbi:hypothetical protein ACHHYP_03518 [Achlya hypogyna]|uniref:PX domain-containing protein n=1 Tax=Achlya hypogyna TaxID=1202772 RepID=A0A1V9Z3R4_ACHHY|nr:hypothetical protein ACHHYP_03518 [Achlya hypogyna]